MGHLRFSGPIRPMLVAAALFAAVMAGAAQTGNEVRQTVENAVKAGRGDDIGKYLNTLTDLDIPGNRGTFGKTQCAKLIADFFTGSRVTAYSTERTGSTGDGGIFTIGEMKAGGRDYRVYFVVKQSEDKWLIHVFRINTM